MSYFTEISYSDTGSLDAFSRLRTSTPEDLFSIQSQYDTNPIEMETGNTGTGVAPSHSSSTRMVELSCTAGTGTSFIQSYQYFPYQPGRSQFIAITGVVGTGVANTTVDTMYGDANNGIIFRQNGTTNLQLILRTSTGGSVSDANIVAQSAWNIDKLNGTGASTVNLDITKAFILVIDLQFLGMGRVRLGFDIDGVIYYAHEFLNANNLAVPYMQSATLPIQMLVTSNASAAPKTAYFKCATVQSEGGDLQGFGFPFSTPETTATAGNGTRVPLLAIRPKTTFNSITNRELFVLNNFTIVNTGTTNDIFWELVVGGNYSGQTFADVNTTYSGFEYTSVPGAYTNLTGGLVIASGYAAHGTGGGALVTPVIVATPAIQSMRYPITLNRAGAVRALGTLTLLVTGIGGTSTCRASFNFKEIR
jgi:hypothetical protein